MIYATSLLLCRRHHRAVHEGRIKVSVNSDGTMLFFTPKGRMLADAPKQRVGADAARQRGWTGTPERLPAGVSKKPAWADGSSGRATAAAVDAKGELGSKERLQAVDASLPAVPSVHPGAPRVGENPGLSNGAALYRDSAIPWEIEAAAREAIEDSQE